MRMLNGQRELLNVPALVDVVGTTSTTPLVVSLDLGIPGYSGNVLQLPPTLIIAIANRSAANTPDAWVSSFQISIQDNQVAPSLFGVTCEMGPIGPGVAARVRIGTIGRYLTIGARRKRGPTSAGFSGGTFAGTLNCEAYVYGIFGSSAGINSVAVFDYSSQQMNHTITTALIETLASWYHPGGLIRVELSVTAGVGLATAEIMRQSAVNVNQVNTPVVLGAVAAGTTLQWPAGGEGGTRLEPGFYLVTGTGNGAICSTVINSPHTQV